MRFKRTTVIAMGLLAFLGGLGFSKTGRLISYELVIAIIIFWLVTIIRLRLLALISTIMLGLCLGWLRGQQYAVNVQALKQLDGVRATAVVQATSDTFYNSRGQLSFDASNLHVIEPNEQHLPGRLLISGFGAPVVYKGDIAQIEGRFYETRGSRQLGMSFAQIDVLENRSNWVDKTRREFSAGLSTAVPEPQASFGLGLLIGQRATIPEGVAQQLSAVGLTHIIAVSGYNLTIIMRAVKRLLDKRSRYQATTLSLALILTFLLMTGMSASIVRAAIVSGLSILAWHYGRTFKPLLLISLAAVITAGWNPLYLWNDIGWYLSFLAFFGVLVLAPLIEKRIWGLKKPKIVGQIMIESVAALIMTTPLILFIFNQISVVALPANLIIVPLVPLAMLTALVAGLAGMLFPAAAGLLAWPATMVMTAMLDIVQIMARIPHILMRLGLSLSGMLLWYGCILFATLILWRVTVKNAKITDMKALETS